MKLKIALWRMEKIPTETTYIEIFQTISALLNDVLSYILQERQNYQILYSIPDLVEQSNNLKVQLDRALARIHSLERRIGFYKSSVNITTEQNVPAAVKMYAEMEDLRKDSKCESLLKKYLTDDMIDDLITIQTKEFHSTLDDCTRSGLIMHYTPIGVFAADADCYDEFGLLFNPIVRDCHPGAGDDYTHPPLHWGNPDALQHNAEVLTNVDKCTIFCSRSLQSYPFFPKMTEGDYVHVMEVIRGVLENFCAQYQPGTFYALETIDEDTKARLRGEGFMFHEGDEAHHAAGSLAHWPIGRAVYVSATKSFVTYINHRDHIKFGCIEKGGDLRKMYLEMVTYGKIFDEYLRCVRHPKYGWLTASPALLGTTLEITASIRLSNSLTDTTRFNQLLRESKLKMSDQVNTPNYVLTDLKSIQCLGLTEYDTIQAFITGLQNVARAENEV